MKVDNTERAKPVMATVTMTIETKTMVGNYLIQNLNITVFHINKIKMKIRVLLH